MRIKSCGLIKIPIEIIQLWPIAFPNQIAGLIIKENNELKDISIECDLTL